MYRSDITIDDMWKFFVGIITILASASMFALLQSNVPELFIGLLTGGWACTLAWFSFYMWRNGKPNRRL